MEEENNICIQRCHKPLRQNQNNNKVTDTIACSRTTGWCLLRYIVSVACIIQHIYIYIYTKWTFVVRLFYGGFRAPNSMRKRAGACFCCTPTREWNIVLLSSRNQSESYDDLIVAIHKTIWFAFCKMSPEIILLCVLSF